MNTNDYDVIDQFRDFALNDKGIELPDDIIADGKLHRFKINGEKSGKFSGAYKLHLDGRPAGFVQNFITDVKGTNWKYTDPDYKKEPITPEKIKADAERKAEYALKADAARKADIESKAQAAIRARKEWNNTKASDNNPYAERKGIQLHNARISEYKGEQQLIIPLQDKDGKLVSLQRIKEKINEDGKMDSVKMLFKEAQKQGAFSVLNKTPDPQIIAIAEGFATTASVIEDTYSVKNNIMGVMAVDAGNLKLVAEVMRELHPNAEILIFGDKGDKDDKGGKAAVEAAQAVNGYSVMPPIAKGDFNDYLTGKTGDITVSLENLINQSMGKVMASEQETKLLERMEVSVDAVAYKQTNYYEVAGEKILYSGAAMQEAIEKAEAKGVESIKLIEPEFGAAEASIYEFKYDGVSWINEHPFNKTIKQVCEIVDIGLIQDIKARAELMAETAVLPETAQKLAVLDTTQSQLISSSFKDSAYKYIESNAAISEAYANALPVEIKQIIDENTQKRAGLESLDDIDKRLNAAENNSVKYYDGHEAFNAGEEAYSGKSVDYKIDDLPVALEPQHRHDNIINKEQFMLGFMENATPEDGFKSIEEAFKTRLPHLNADEYLNIAFETVERTSNKHDYSELPKLPLRDSIENPEMNFEVINRADGDKLEVFTNASDAIERAVEVNAETIKIREDGQFTTAAWKNEDAEFVMPEGESFSKKYAVNTIEKTAVAEQVTESAQDQSTSAVEQSEPETAQSVPENVASNYEYENNDFPTSPYDNYEPDYSNAPQDEDIDYEAHYAEQERFIRLIEQDESMLNQQSKFFYQVEDTGVQSVHAIEAQESAIKSDSEIINYVDDNQAVAGVFHKNGNEYINQNPEPNTPVSLSQAQKDDDVSHTVSIEIRAEQNLTLDRKTKSYPELDVKLAAVDSKEFFLIKGDEYKAQAQQSIAMNAALSKDYTNALPQEIIAKQSMLDLVKQKTADLAGKIQDKLSPKQSQPEQPEVKPVLPTSTAPATAEKVDISKPVEPENKPEQPKLIPKDVADKYLQVDDKFYFRKNKDVVIFEDKGAKLETKLNSPSVAADLVRIAAERGWKEIKITGTPEFKSEVWMEAESRGIATTGYKPTEVEKAMLQERLAKNPTNTIEQVQVAEKTNTSVRQMLDDSVDKKLAEQHLKTNPKLKETFEYLDSKMRQLEERGETEHRINVIMDESKRRIAEKIEAGIYPEYPKVSVEQTRQDTRQDKQPEPQKTEAQVQKEAVATKTKSKDRDMVME